MVTDTNALNPARGERIDGRDGTTAASKPTRSGRHRPRVRPYHKHGLTALRRTVEAIGGRLLDGRTTLAKQLAAWKADLVRDLGGDVSTQQAAVIDLAVLHAPAPRLYRRVCCLQPACGALASRQPNCPAPRPSTRPMR